MATSLNLHDALDEFGKNLGKRQISDNTRKAFWGDVNIFARFLTGEGGDAEDSVDNGTTDGST